MRHAFYMICRPIIKLITSPALLLGALTLVCMGGCPYTNPLTSSDIDLDAAGNDTFATATPITLGDDDQIDFNGTIDSGDDTDIYDLGLLAAGDRLYVDVKATSGNLDPMAAVFDEREYLLAFSDDRESDASDLNPLIDVIVPSIQGRYYLGVTPYSGGSSSGDYLVTLRITRGMGVLDPEPQTVFLDWQGGDNIRVNNVGVFDIDPFDAADMGPYTGRTDEMKDTIQAVIADLYDGFDFILLNSDDDARPSGPYSTVYFGGDNSRAFAIAEQIDTFNADQSDDAIIFTDGFRNAFSTSPSLSRMARAVGNTAAHEIGHLLGLVHTSKCSSLMDTTCSNDALLGIQAFELAPLDDTVFPVGLQNAEDLIEWAIGLSGN